MEAGFLMVSLPELENGKRYWPETWYGDRAWKTGGLSALLPTKECPQIASKFQKSYLL